MLHWHSFVFVVLPFPPLPYSLSPTSLSQVFTVSKDLVPRVLSKIVESVADEMCRLMQCVSSFSKNGALQVRSQEYIHAVIGHLLTHNKTLTHNSTPTLGGDFPVVSDNAIFQFKLPTADSWRCSCCVFGSVLSAPFCNPRLHHHHQHHLHHYHLALSSGSTWTLCS